MDKEVAAKYLESTDPTKPVPEVTEPEPVVVTPKPTEKERINLPPLIGILLVVGIVGGAFS